MTIKYAPDGNRLWLVRHDGGPDPGRHWSWAIAIDAERNVVIGGQTGLIGGQASFLTLQYGQEPSFIRGDCNGDGHVIGQVSDAMAILRYFFLGEGIDPPLCEAACDANGNGRTDDAISDAIYLLEFNFLGTTAPPGPFPRCGYADEGDSTAACESWSPGCA